MARGELDEGYIQREVAGLTRGHHVIFVNNGLGEAERNVEQALMQSNANAAAVRTQTTTLRETAASRGRVQRVSGRQLMHPVYVDLLQRQENVTGAAIGAMHEGDVQQIRFLRETLTEEGTRVNSLVNDFGYRRVGRFGQILSTARQYLSAPLRRGYNQTGSRGRHR
jgi:hypothetical protein